MTVKNPFWIPMSGSWSEVPPAGTGNGGKVSGSRFGTPGIGTGMGTAPGVCAGMSMLRPGTEMRPIEVLDDRVSEPVMLFAITVATVSTFDSVP